jgi:hypothetical protein
VGEDRAVEAPGWLSRYRRGERDQVWLELRQLGARVREPGLVDEARLVCDEMARRARSNVELVVARLTEQGYRFHTNDAEQRAVVPFVPATSTADEHAEWLEHTFGPVPLTLLSWVRLVGDVWLVGTHPQGPRSAGADPLVLELEGTRYGSSAVMRASLEGERDVWHDLNAEDGDQGPFVLPLAPDRLVKDDVSGGAPYGMVLPDGCADGLFVAETTMPFVSYLNWVFAHGGFPYASGSDSGWWRVRTGLAQDLLLL